ncbi:MAG: EamA family transporter [Rubricella sp.]
MTRQALLAWTAVFATIAIWASFLVMTRAAVGLNLGPLDVVILRFVPAALILLPVVGSALPTLEAGTLAFQILMHGILSGVVSTFTYAYALRHIAASKVAACAALVPPLAALGGWVFLGEPIGWLKATGIALVAFGVLLASGAFDGRISGRVGPSPRA